MFARRPVRWMSAAVVALAVLGGLSVFSRSPKPGAKNQWWMGPPSAWAADIDAALARAGVKGVTCRERIMVVMADGASHASSTWCRFYVSRDSYRRDIYDGESLREVQWCVPDGEGIVQTGYRLDTRTWGKLQHKGGFGSEDPVRRLRFYVGLLDKADRLLGTQTIDGHQCVGFEIRASAYGDNPATWIDRIWFDVNTRLPVQIEQAGRPVTGDASRTLTTVQDQFDYSPNLPDDTFSPKIPEGFTFNNSPDAPANQSQTAP